MIALMARETVLLIRAYEVTPPGVTCLSRARTNASAPSGNTHLHGSDDIGLFAIVQVIDQDTTRLAQAFTH